jgi:hypothetical protein
MKITQANSKRLSLKEAAQYINERLDRKWKNPIASIESNVYRGKLKISAYGKRKGKRSFTIRELDRFVEAKNMAAAPAGGQVQTDLSEHNELFGYHTDGYIASVAGCAPITVMRYRQREGIPNFREAGLLRIEAIRERLGKEPAGRLAAEIRVNRMTLVRFMGKHKIAAYVREAGK